LFTAGYYHNAFHSNKQKRPGALQSKTLIQYAMNS
jgi:hypothetical protein